MAKKEENNNNEFEAQVNDIVLMNNSGLAKFDTYLNPFELREFVETMPEWIAGDALVGRAIAIHSFEYATSFHFKTEFVKARIEIAGHEGQFDATFFSVGCKTFFKALQSAQIPLPVVVGVIRQNSTYAFQDINKFMANNR